VLSPPARLRSFLELFALCGLAITQPVLDLFGRAPQQFTFRAVGGWGIVVFALVVAVVPAAAIWVVEQALRLASGRAAAVVHLAAVVGLVAAVVSQLVGTAPAWWVQLVVAAVAGGLAGVAYVRVQAVRSWLAVMALAPVVFVGLFLVGSPTSGLFASPEAVALEGGVDNPVPVVLVVFDELSTASLLAPDGSIDAGLYPGFAELAGESTWYRNATTVSGSTWHAVPALASGRNVRNGTAPNANDHPETLFTLLGGVYDLNVTESVTTLCPSGLCQQDTSSLGGERQLLRDAGRVWWQRVWPGASPTDPVAGFVEQQGDPDAKGEDRGFFADFELNQPARVQTFTAGITGAEPALHYLHLLLPHVPLRHLPDGRVYDHPDPDFAKAPDEATSDQWEDDGWLVDLAYQRHLMQVAYTDALVGSIIGDLKAAGVWDEALVIVTSDHGMAFSPGGAIRGLAGQDLTTDELAEIAWVPLFVKEPGQRTGNVSDANVLTIDIVPTILEVLGLDAPWELDGQSVGTPRTNPDKPFWPVQVEAFGVGALEPIDMAQRVSLADVVARGPDRLLGPGSTAEERLWSVGPARDLVGTSVGSPPAGTSLVRVDPGIEGTGTVTWGFSPDLSPGDPVALVADGEVVATGAAFAKGGRTGWAVLVPGDPAGPEAPELWRIQR